MRFSVLKLFVLLMLGCTPVFADAITIGSPGDAFTGDCAPFGCGLEYQQVYGGVVFPGAVSITGLTFFNNNFVPGSIANANYVISLSTTAAPVDGLNSIFADNLGADNQMFFSGSLGGFIGDTNQFIIVGTPFNFDPSQGNLLLTISKDDGGFDFGIFLDFASGAATGTFSRAYSFSSSGVADVLENNTGLVTEFAFSPTPPPPTTTVPEPTSLELLAFGIAGITVRASFRRMRQSLFSHNRATIELR